MVDARSVKALVPIKAHSERVPGKNVRPLCGKLLLFWALSAISASRHVAELVIDTDSEEIAEQVGRFFKATVLFRPDHLRGDMVGINPLIEFELSRTEGEFFLQTHVTNPLLTTGTINAAIEAFLGQRESDSLFSVTSVRTRLYWADGRPINHDPANMVRTQDLPVVWAENSCLYLFSRTSFVKHGHRVGGRPRLFPISPLEAVDIDEEEDFRMAEALMAKRLGGRQG